MNTNNFIHPYIPNSVQEIKDEMLKEIGVNSIDELYEDIPEHLKFHQKLNIPDQISSEYELKSHVEKILNKNLSTEDLISFLGAGSYNHYVPAVVDEIINRSEFLTAYAGEPYEDKGRFQTLFEYESLMAELLEFDVVNVPTYDWGQAASTSCRMAGRITGRNTILVSETIHPDRLKIIQNYCVPVMEVKLIKTNYKTGQIDTDDLYSKITNEVAGFYFENPNYFGIIETNGQVIADKIHSNGSELIVGVNPVSLGILNPPSAYGADIACGDIQCLGNHMAYGGTLGGFISSRDEVKYVMEYPSRLFGITKTAVEGEWGFGDVAYDRTSFGVREKGKEFIGTAAALYGIATAVYLSLLGPRGIKEVALTCLQKTEYLKKKISEITGVKIRFSASTFNEFVADFSGTGLDINVINKKLLAKGILGGKDLTSDFNFTLNCALFCATEITSKKNIDLLVQHLKQIIAEGI